MAGGGFMKHASDTNRIDKAQKQARRVNYENTHPDKSILNHKREKLEFPELSDEQIRIEREKIRKHFEKIKKRNAKMILFICLIFGTIGLYLFLNFLK